MSFSAFDNFALGKYPFDEQHLDRFLKCLCAPPSEPLLSSSTSNKSSAPCVVLLREWIAFVLGWKTLEAHTKLGRCLFWFFFSAASSVNCIPRCSFKFDLHMAQHIDHADLDDGPIYISEAKLISVFHPSKWSYMDSWSTAGVFESGFMFWMGESLVHVCVHTCTLCLTQLGPKSPAVLYAWFSLELWQLPYPLTHSGHH